MPNFTPDATEVGLRLDAFLSKRLPETPRALLRQALEAGRVTTDRGHRCAKGDKTRAGWTYCLAALPTEATLEPNADIRLNIVYEDADLLALNKPAAIDCQPNGPTERETLANGLLAYAPDVKGVGDSPLTCGILHRIDHDTSGLVLVARNQDVYAALRAQFAAHTVEKRYLALVAGTIRTAGRLEHYLAHNPRCPGRMVDAALWKDVKRPMHAITEYRPAKHYVIEGKPYTLLEVDIQTGVTHQIRAQLSLAGMAIVGDRRYGGVLLPNFPRHFLHAHRATFEHPVSHQRITLEAPLPPDLTALLARK